MKKITYSIIIALHLQLSIFLGLLFSTIIGLIFIANNGFDFSRENLAPTFFGAIIAFVLFVIGHYLHKQIEHDEKIDFKLAVLIVINAWLIASFVSAIVFILAGYPNSPTGEVFGFFRTFTDSFFESMSGLTTTGSSILLEIESLPKSVLMWRTTTHWIGGMGIVYMTITVINNFKYSRFNLINAEVESPEATEFKDEFEARNSGFDFIKIYSLLTLIMFLLLIISGILFRETPYSNWFDNFFDALNHSLTTLGTGGFSHYSQSAGLYTVSESGQIIIGGLQNKVSEWIITIFMFMSGANFGIWYLVFYKRDFKSFFRNIEMRVYIALSLVTSLSIALVLLSAHYDNYSVEQALRYSFFSVGSVISTTGLANVDFTLWPIAAVAILFVVYFIGGTVGSTAGGLKVKRFIAFFKNVRNEIRNFTDNNDQFKTVNVDTSKFNRRDMSLISINIAVYFLLFIGGGILILLFDSAFVDFTSALNASIANLGNIGPTDFYGAINDGPAGGYAGFGIASKWVMIFLMLFGRIGVLNIFFFLGNFRKR